MRALDEPIPLAEELYRGASDDDVAGASVSLAVIDPQGSSCNRQKYGTPESVLAPEFGRTRTVFTTPNDLALLPSTVTLLNGIEYEIFAVDVPEEGKDAHCEVRWRRTDAAPSTANAKIKNQEARLQMRAYVARAFRPFVVSG